jgi:hypothetical protein
VDVTSFAPGSSVRCSDCGGLMRVPTGRTGVNPAVKAPVAGQKTSTRTKVAAVGGGSSGTRVRTKTVQAAERETSTRVRQAAAGRATQFRPRKSNTGLYVLLGVGALALIVVGAVFLLGTPSNTPPAPGPSPIAKTPVAPKPPAPSPAPAAAPEIDPTPAPAPAPRGDEAARTNWEDVLRQLRGGGGFDVEGRPEQVYFQRVQRMGKRAYPYLVRSRSPTRPRRRSSRPSGRSG